MVQHTWQQTLMIHNPFLLLHVKLQRTGRKLKAWARAPIGNVKPLLFAAKQLDRDSGCGPRIQTVKCGGDSTKKRSEGKISRPESSGETTGQTVLSTGQHQGC